ncbi:MAG: hypothetical protein R3E82_14435 [Pseudomonadales bacterium]|nr:hypothetical protein [Pseudomonadales bacterium]
MSDADDVLLDATTALVPALLGALDGLAWVGRRLNPPDLNEVVAAVASLGAPVAAGLERFKVAPWPEHLSRFSDHVIRSATETLEAFASLERALTSSNPILGAYRALSYQTRAVEVLYPVSFMLPPVSRFFLSDAHRGDEALQARLAAADPSREEVGIMHASNGVGERGGFSLYVPEYYDGSAALPLVVALHGGSGHGRSFLWSWLKDARTRGVILVTPSSRDSTWSLMGPDIDSANLADIVDHIRSTWRVDASRMLLTGMSDGGTFSYVSGLQDDSPFTHLAPISASFHPLLIEAASVGRLRGLPIYLVHGVLDWMFPPEVARMARDTLTAAGADLVYQELEDLSHTYPREQNDLILDWLLR